MVTINGCMHTALAVIPGPVFVNMRYLIAVCVFAEDDEDEAVSYTHLTLPTKVNV